MKLQTAEEVLAELLSLTLSVQEAADRLGRSHESLRLQTWRGTFPSLKVGRATLVARAAVDAELAQPRLSTPKDSV